MNVTQADSVNVGDTIYNNDNVSVIVGSVELSTNGKGKDPIYVFYSHSGDMYTHDEVHKAPR